MSKATDNQMQALDGQPGYTAKRLCEAVAPTSFSEAEAFFLDVRRRIVLAQGGLGLRTLLDDRVKAFTARRYSPAVGGEDGRPTDSPVS